MITGKHTNEFQGYEMPLFSNDKSIKPAEKQIERVQKRHEELLPLILEAHVLALIGTALS